MTPVPSREVQGCVPSRTIRREMKDAKNEIKTEISGPDFLTSCQSNPCIISCRPAQRNGDRCEGRSVRWERINMALRLSGCKLRVLRVPLASGRLGRTVENCDAQQKYGGREGTPKTEVEHERGAADRDDRASERTPRVFLLTLFG